MNIVRTDTGDLTATIRIELTPEDYVEKVEKELKNLQKKVSMPGFRPGKVPFGLVKKMYGKSAKLDEVNNILTNAINNYVAENNLNILGSPVAKIEDSQDIDWDNNTDISFNFLVGFVPEFEVDLSKLPEIERYNIEADEKTIDNVIDSLRRKGGSIINPDISEEEDLINIEYEELDAKGELVEDGIKGTTMLSPKYLKNDKELFIGLTVNSEVTFTPNNIIDNATEIASMFNIPKEKAETLTSDFKAKVTSIQRRIPAEMNEQFFAEAYPYKKINTEEELREVLRIDANKTFENESREVFEHNVKELLNKEIKFSLPDEFLKIWLKDNADKDVDLDTLEKEYPMYESSLRMQLIENKLVKDHNIDVTYDEMKEYVKSSFKMRFGGAESNLSDDFDERLNRIADSVLKNEEEAKRLMNKLFSDKLLDLYMTTLRVTEKNVTYDEFIKLANENHSH